MGKKRKAGGRPSGPSKDAAVDRSKFDVEDTFDDSEDEFQAGRDHVLLEEAPEAKRRRKVDEEGLWLRHFQNLCLTAIRGDSPTVRRGNSGLRVR